MLLFCVCAQCFRSMFATDSFLCLTVIVASLSVRGFMTMCVFSFFVILNCFPWNSLTVFWQDFHKVELQSNRTNSPKLKLRAQPIAFNLNGPIRQISTGTLQEAGEWVLSCCFSGVYICTPDEGVFVSSFVWMSAYVSPSLCRGAFRLLLWSLASR